MVFLRRDVAGASRLSLGDAPMPGGARRASMRRYEPGAVRSAPRLRPRTKPTPSPMSSAGTG
jgi:hypothetical protein